MRSKVLLIALTIISFCSERLQSQNNVNQCDNPAPTDSIFCGVAGNYIDLYTLDLSGSPSDSGNITIFQPQADLPCCGDEVHMNARCAALELFLHPEAVGIAIRFIGNNASNGTFRIGDALCTDNNGATLSLNDIDNQEQTICLDPAAAASFLATTCKPGGADYCLVIRSLAAESFGDTIIIADDVNNCATQVNVNSSVQLNNITWTAINGSLSYLDCGPGPLDCLDPIFTPPGTLTMPTTFIYEVCGEYIDPFCGNLGVIVCDTVYVEVIPLINVQIDNIINCDYNYPYTINAMVSPQFPTFEYHWYDAFGGPSGGGNLLAITNVPTYDINNQGNYSLYVMDTDLSYSCPITFTYDFNVTDLPQPPAIIIPPAVICSGTNLTFTADQVMSNTAEFTVDYYWTFPNSNQGIAIGPGPHIVTYTDCDDKDAYLDVVISSLIDPTVFCTYSDQLTVPVDITPPTITAHPPDITVDCVADPPWGPNDITATDNCSGITIDTSSVATPGVCSGEYTITRTWLVTDNCGNTATEEQIVTVTDNIAPIVDPLTGGTFDCVASVPAPDPGIVNAQDQGCGSVTVTFAGDVGSNVCGGTLTRTYNVTDDCGNVTPVTQVFTLNDNIPPTIICPPGATYQCVAEVPALPTTYAEFVAAGGSASDNCGIVESSFTSNESSSGICPTTIIRTFTIEDSCGAQAVCQQTISVVPPPFFWVNPPADITLDCGQADDFIPLDLTYSNLQGDVCDITGTVPPSVTPNYNECGGTILVHYEYTDVCGNTITHDQTVMVTRAPLPVWINPPADITLSCEAALTFTPGSIDYTNSDNGSCVIQGTVNNPVATPNFNNCGGTITVDWSYTDPCGYVLTHQQIVTVNPAPPVSWINPPADITITCNNAEIFTAPNLDYSNAANGSCIIQGNVAPQIDPQYDECGGFITVTWVDIDECGRPIPAHVQTVTVLPADIASWVNPPPPTLTFDCNSAATYNPGPISYSNSNNGTCLISGQVLPSNIDSNFTECGGSITVDWEFTDNCNRQITYQQVVTVLPATPAAWVNPPVDITLSCNQADTLIVPDLEYSNAGAGSCLIQGFAPPIVSPNYTDCAGGTITIDWEFTDACNNTITHTQNITVLAAPEPQWINPPADTTITCDDAFAYVASQLGYTNYGVGTCLIDGVADPVVNPVFDMCGGTITVNWEFTDACNRQITHQQIITVSPADIPAWVNPPGPLTISCDQALTYVVPDLSYDNASGASCIISGSVSPVVTPNFTECGGDITAVWDYIDPCGRPIQHSQVITVDPSTPAQWVNPPGPITITCNDALSFVPANLDYSNGSSGTCDISGNVPPSNVNPQYTECGGTITIDWEFTDACNRQIIHQQIVTVEPAAPPVFSTPPADITITCDVADGFTAPDITYTNSESSTCEITGTITPVIQNSFNECGGSITVTWDFTDACNRSISYVQTVTVVPAAPPVWINPPSDVTVSCDEATSLVFPQLEYSNAGLGTCLVQGFIDPVVSPNYSECGGTILLTWDYTDSCSQAIHHEQTITVLPSAPADWVNPPAQITISCNEADTFSAPSLLYSNNGLGGCLIEGQAPPQMIKTIDECGGAISISWEFTDNCNRTIQWTQNILVDAAPAPTWINPPLDSIISCADAFGYIGPSLDYTNAGIGVCIISGSIVPVATPDFTACGGTIELVWTYTDPCNRTIDHTQILTVEPALEPLWDNPPSDISITCSEAINFSPETLTITNGDAASCDITESITPVVITNFDECGGTISVSWDYTDPCGRIFNHTQFITVTPSSEPEWLNAPADITITCAEAEIYLAPDLNYSNSNGGVCEITGFVPATQDNDFTECGGEIRISWSYTDNCSRTINHTQIVSVLPSPEAAFIDVPDDITLSCSEAVEHVPEDLTYSNLGAGGCLIAGSVPGDVNAQFDVCGGTIEITWTFTDACDRTIEHTQLIMVEEADQAIYIDPPADLTITCDQADDYSPDDVFYSNGDQNCPIEGFDPPVSISREYDQCGGFIYYNWFYQDDCGRSIFHSMEVAVLPAPEPAWLQLPSDSSISCEFFDDIEIPDLHFTNGQSGSCTIEGSVPGILVEIDDDLCNPQYQIQWQYTDECGLTLSHVQNIYLFDTTRPIITGTPADITVHCDNIPDPPFINNVIDAIDNCRKPQLEFNEEQQPGPCENIFILHRTWTADDECGNTAQTEQFITVHCPPDLTISILPSDIVCEGEMVTFNSTIVPPYTNTYYQWQYSSNGTSWTNIEDGNTSQWMIDSAYSIHQGFYRLIAADSPENLFDPDCSVISNELFFQVLSKEFTILNRTICRGEQVIVGNTSYNETGNYTEILIASTGCDSIVQLNLVVNEHSDTILIKDICQGENVVVGSEIFNTTGVYNVQLANRRGCDSLVTLNLTVHEPSNEIRTETICEGQSIEINGEEFNMTGSYLVSMMDQYGCDSLISLQLEVINPVFTDLVITICDGESYNIENETFNTTGIYQIDLTAASGCDSIVNLDLTVTSEIQNELNRTICTGDSIFFDGNYILESGQYSASYISISGCDSTVTLNLSVVDEIVYELEVEICEGESYTVDGTDYSESGVFLISLQSKAGCDSLIIFTLIVNENYDITLNESICSGEFVEVNGVPYNASGTYDIPLLSSKGCDSIIHLNLEVNEKYFVTLNETYCEGGSVQIGNNTYSKTGIYVDSFLTDFGCDSIIILNLTINPIYDTTLVAVICAGGSFSVGSQSYQTSGIYDHSLVTEAGCDSLVRLDLTVVDELTTEINVQICNGSTYDFGNEILSEAGTYTATYPSSLGCDSVVTLNLSTVPVLTYSYDDYICEGQTYEFFGTNYSLPGSYNHTLQSTQGCDSIVTVNLSVAPLKFAEEDVAICEGESHNISDQTLTETGTYDIIFSTSQGCDSTVTVNLVVHPTYIDSITATICESEVYNFDNSNLNQSGIYYADLISKNGCDSSVVLLLDVIPSVYDTIETKICNGESYNFGSQVLSSSGTYTEKFTSSFGCDSIVTLNLEVLNLIIEESFVQICSGYAYEFNGEQYTESTSQTATFTSILGCDSVVTLNLAVLDQIETFDSLDLCEGDQYIFGDSTISLSGTYTDTLASIKGCDSISTIELVFHPTYLDSMEVTICDGEGFTLANQTITESGYHDFQLSSIFGCDSMVSVHLIIIPTQRDTIDVDICQGTTYTIDSTELTESGFYDFAYSTGADCDSIVTINLTVLEEIIESVDVQICTGGSYSFHDSIYTTSVQETITLSSHLGCDSTVNLNLEVLNQLTTSLDISICSGESYTFDNQVLMDSGTYVATYVSTQGCDSIVTLNLGVLDLMEESIEAFICEGTSYNFDNQSLNESGTYQATFIAQNGCDSVVTLNLSVSGTITQNIEVTICRGETYFFDQDSLKNSGEYSKSFTSTSGCDSVVMLDLNVVDGFEEQQNHTICPGETVTIDSAIYTQDTMFSVFYVSSAGCDSTVFYQITVLPEIGLSTEDYIICEGDAVQIVLSGAEGRPISWSPAGSLSCDDCANPTADPISTTTYTAMVEGCNDKIHTADVTVEVLPVPTVQAPGDVTISSGQSISLTATREEILSEVSWYQQGSDIICTGCETITVNPISTTEYTVVASNSIGCQTEDNVIVFLEDECELDKIEAVNAMTPNDDGFNDFLDIRNNGLSEVVLVQVFNRWGEIVFESQSIDDQWDGSYRGQKVIPGVFMFLVKVQCIGGKETKVIKGNVTVIR